MKRVFWLLTATALAVLALFWAFTESALADREKGVSNRPQIEVELLDVNAKIVRTWDWTLTQSATSDQWDLLRGDTGTVRLTISATKQGWKDAYLLEAKVRLTNHTSRAVTIPQVRGKVAGQPVKLECDVKLPYKLPAGGKLVCSIATTLSKGDAVQVEVWVPGRTDGKVSRLVNFGTRQDVNDRIDVLAGGERFVFLESGSANYERQFTCPEDEGPHFLEVRIEQTGQTAQSEVVVNCYVPEARVGGRILYDLIYLWGVTNVGNVSELWLAPGESAQVVYEVEVSIRNVEVYIPRAEVSLFLTNLTPLTVFNAYGYAGVVDLPDDSTSNCGYILSIEPFQSGGLCRKYISLPDLAPRVAAGTAYVRNWIFAPDGSISETTGTSEYHVTQEFEAGEPDREHFKCEEVRVMDEASTSVIGNVCAAEAPQVLYYEKTVGPYAACGEYEYNTIVSNNTSNWAEWTVKVHVPCDD